MAGDSRIQIKKVRPYPFKIQLGRVGGAEVILGSVVKLSQVGFLVEINNFLPIVGDEYTGEFVLPTINFHFLVKLLVVKTYDSFRSEKGKVERAPKEDGASGATVVVNDAPVSIHLAEMHFVHSTADHNRYITNWLKTIGQIEK